MSCRGAPREGVNGNGTKQRNGRRTIDDLVEGARGRYVRVTAVEAHAEAVAGRAVLVDTRSDDQRATQGHVRLARHHPLSVLEWRLDPDAGFAWDADVTLATRLVLLCREGYSSSLAVARLLDLGFTDVTDV